MKKLLIFLIIAHSMAFVCTGKQEIRGLWAATVFRLDFPSAAGLGQKELEQELTDLVIRTKEAGFNSLFFQVRPCADAFYSSRYFPWSAWLTGKQGQPPESGFDPLAYLVQEAHRRDLQVHAWVNPFRITRNSADSKADALATLSAMHPAVIHPDWVVYHTDGCLYFDPGLPEVRRLVRDGVLEIAQNYDVDGIHFDDYFYPGRDFDDSVSYSIYGPAYRSRDDFRTQSVNALISGVHHDLEAIRPDLLFGVSPTGIWANQSTDPRGSDTAGYQSKVDSYADALAWMEAGTVDYIAPQLYWHIGSPEGDFRTLLQWWREQADRTGTDLLIGLAGYRTAEAADPVDIWYGGDQLRRQLELLQGGTEGYILFRAGSLFDSPAVAQCFASAPVAEEVSEYWPLTRRWLTLGSEVNLYCSDADAPTLALWNDSSVILDREGAGTIPNAKIGSQPVLYLRFKGTSLLVHTSPGLVTVPEPVECLSFTETADASGLKLVFAFSGPVDSSAVVMNDRVLLDIPGQNIPLLFETRMLTALDCSTLSPGVRYTLTPPIPPQSVRLEHEDNLLYLLIQ